LGAPASSVGRAAGLLSKVFPDGIWVDASVIIELEDLFGSSIPTQTRNNCCELLVERGYDAAHYAEMAEIKRSRPGMRHPDIASVILAHKHGGTCLSSDGAVRKTCAERGILISGQLGCLKICVQRLLLKQKDANALLRTFLDNGLYLPEPAVDDFLRGS
jgi:predicted nucleic acid-binding protein